MLIHKTFKYRVYPSKESEKRLLSWEPVMRCLWNLAHEQRIMGLSRPAGEKKYTTSIKQGVELTDLKKDCPWMGDVPRHVLVQILENLGKAWNRCFEGISRRPNWKKKTNKLSFTEFDHKGWSIQGNKLKFPKLATMHIEMSRPLQGKPKSCTLKRDGDQWYATIVCDVQIPDPAPRIDPRIGLDRGLTNFIGTSDRELVPNPKFLEKGLKALARAQRTVSRRIKGSKNREKAKNRVSRIHRKIRRQRDHFLHVLSSQITKSHGVVVLEKLNVHGMVRNRSLARHIAGSSWSKFAEFLKYKQSWTGGSVQEVPAHGTSQTCFKCKLVDPKSRQGDKFHCTRCGHQDHADLNAPLNILDRASRSVQPTEGSSNCAPRRSRKVETRTKKCT